MTRIVLVSLFLALSACGGGQASTEPVVYGIWPDKFVAGASGAALEVTGEGFTAASVVFVDGTALPTTFRASSRLLAAAPASLFATTGRRELAVSVAPTERVAIPRGARGYIHVENPGPTLASFARAAPRRGASEVVALYGSGFVASSVVVIDGVEVATWFESPTHLEIARPAGRTHDVVVRNPPPGGGDSAPLVLHAQ